MIRAIRSTVLSEAGDNVSFDGVVNGWFQRHVIKNGLRSEPQVRRLIRQHLKPAFAGMAFVDVRRRHISALLDKIEDENGARQANSVLSILSSVAAWYAKRDDAYNSPIIRGMGRAPKTKRSRILNDQELATLWREEGVFGNFTKLLLITCQRASKLFWVRWDDLQDGVWTIRTEPREKGNGGVLRLPPIAFEILEDQRRRNPDSPFVFALRKGTPKTRLGRLKTKFEASHDSASVAVSRFKADGAFPYVRG